MGVYLINCPSANYASTTIEGNSVYADVYSSDGAIRLENTNGTGSYRVDVVNNVVSIGYNGAGYSSKGMCFMSSDYINCFYNTVQVSGNRLSDIVMYFETGGNNTVKNNNLVIEGTLGDFKGGYGIPLYTYNQTNFVADYNNLYTPGNFVAKNKVGYDEFGYSTVSALYDAQGTNEHSIKVFPALPAKDSILGKSYWLNGKGVAIQGYGADFYGNARDNSTPDIGAYEFENPPMPLVNGEYTLGATGDFPNFDTLLNVIMLNGIDAATTIVVDSGKYQNVYYMLKDIPGASESNTLTFTSIGDVGDVRISNVQTSAVNYVFYLNGTDYVTFENLSIEAGGSGYSNLIILTGSCHNLTFYKNVFNAPNTGSETTNMVSIYSASNAHIDFIEIYGNEFNYNSYGLLLQCDGDYKSEQLSISGNTFMGSVAAIKGYYLNAPEIKGNVISGYQKKGIYLEHCSQGVAVSGNKISSSTSGGEGLTFYYCDGTGVNPIIAYNNFVQNVGTKGITASYSNYCELYFNNVNISGDNSSSYAFYAASGSNLKLKNNILHNVGRGYAYYTNNTGNVIESDYNTISTEDNYRYAYWGANKTSLSELQAASSKDAASLEIIPEFISSSDLHVLNSDYMGKGTPVSGILKDIDGNVRDVSKPDMGADELYCESYTLNIPDLEVCVGGGIVIDHESENVAYGSRYFWDFDGNSYYDDTTSTIDTVINFAYLDKTIVFASVMLKQPGGCESISNFKVTVKEVPDAPVVADTIGCYGQDMPPLVADGDDIKWYANEELTEFLVENDTLFVNVGGVGEYSYYATQTVNGCESEAAMLTMEVYNSPQPPYAEGAVVCFGDDIPVLEAYGANVKWYADEDLTELLLSVNQFKPDIVEPGIYTYYVTQTPDLCESRPLEVELRVKPAPVLSAQITNIDCKGHDFGTINLSVSSGNAPYYFDWSNGETTEDITNLSAGEYSVEVKDIDACSVTDTFEVFQPDSIKIQLITNDSDCSSNNGTATAVASGGIEPYSYEWSSGDSVPVVDSLASGLYVLTVTDDNGCKVEQVFSINDLGAPEIDVQGVLDVSCYGLSNGAISTNVSGGTGVIDYLWSNGESTTGLNNLTAGAYELTVVDEEGCQSIVSVVVDQPEPIFIDLTIFDATCGEDNGSANAEVLGGTPDFNYSWSTGSSASGISDLALGTYKLTVADANACEAVKTFSVSEIGAPVIYVDSVYEGTCGDENGAIYITVYGDMPEYDFLWSNGSKEEDLIGVGPGEYDVMVSDSNSCSSLAVVEIPAEKPEGVSICMVTVDTSSNKNVCIFNKSKEEGVDHYNLYKESSQSGVYLHIGTVGGEAVNEWTDENSNAAQRSNRYKVSAVNTCEVESELSDFHKTMHLTISLGLNNVINLNWDHYEGFEILTYYIHRYTETKGWHLYDSISSNLTSYTDVKLENGFMYYMIEIKHPTGCEVGRANNKNSSRSNISNALKPVLPYVWQSVLAEHVYVYPNPTSAGFTLDVEFKEEHDVEIQIFNAQGLKVYGEQIPGKVKMLEKKITTALDAGLYFVRIKTESGSVVKPLVVNQ
jgi:hypothetical protein